MRPDDATLLDILNAAQQATAFLGGMDVTAFAQDSKTQSAVLHQMLLLGEAVKRLSPEFRSAHPELDLGGFAGMRDILIHQYDSVDLNEVYRAVREDIPALTQSLLPWVSASEEE
jgi:uncharacterized protein with HEPN domain